MTDARPEPTEDQTEPVATPHVEESGSRAAALVAVGIALAWLALRVWTLAFHCDDAFISFRYCRNLVEGHGLVFNVGERVEGYTNFLWILELAALWSIDIPPAVGSHILSLGATVGVVGCTAWMARGSPPSGRWWVVWAAVLLLATDRNFAVWATSGLEMRQFTLFVMAALVGFALRPWALGAVVASVGCGLAVLSRPEGALVFAVGAPLWLADRWRHRELTRPLALSLIGPFVFLFGSHLVFRLLYYQSLVPNTYFAKHVRPWPEMGARYLALVGIESGLYLVVPLALAGWLARTARHRRMADGAPVVAVALHALFMIRLGGDHFEFRLLDWWWPILFVGAAEGAWIAASALNRPRRPTLGTFAAIVAALVVYGSAIEVAHDARIARQRARGAEAAKHVMIDAKAHPMLRLLGLGLVLDRYNRLGRDCVHQLVATRHHVHKSFFEEQWEKFGPYEGRPDLLPEDAVMVRVSVGVAPFVLEDLTVVDYLGLTDPVVARNPSVRENDARFMAHDRRPPKGYLRERGMNISVHGAARTVVEALGSDTYALQLEDDLFLPFRSAQIDWVDVAFEGRTLWWRRLGTRPVDNHLRLPEGSWVGTRVLGDFEGGIGDWRPLGDAFLPQRRDLDRIDGFEGDGLASSRTAAQGNLATGELRSPTFRIRSGAVLGFLVGGGDKPQVGVRLLADGVEVESWRGENSHDLRFLWVPLKRWAGSELAIEIYDNAHEEWGFVHADHFVLYKVAGAHRDE